MDLASAEAIAQIVSAIGVVITLAYLAVQIRQSSTISRANIRQQLAQQQIEMLRVVAVDPFLRSASAKMFQRQALNPEEGFALLSHAGSALRLFESCHAQWEYGTLPDADWEPIRRRYAGFLTHEPYRWAFQYGEYNARFAAMVREILEQQPSDARADPDETEPRART